MKKVALSKVKDDLSRYLRIAEKHELVITRHGKPAGLLVGFGARLGGGCTSGHGVCGVARLSARSIVATAIFMATAIVVVALMRHGGGG